MTSQITKDDIMGKIIGDCEQSRRKSLLHFVSLHLGIGNFYRGSTPGITLLWSNISSRGISNASRCCILQNLGKPRPCVLHLLWISQALLFLTVRRLRDLAKYVFFYVLQYISLSKRLVPEAINFLCGILFLGSSKEGHTRK